MKLNKASTMKKTSVPLLASLEAALPVPLIWSVAESMVFLKHSQQGVDGTDMG